MQADTRELLGLREVSDTAKQSENRDVRGLKTTRIKQAQSAGETKSRTGLMRLGHDVSGACEMRERERKERSVETTLAR
jgi:hypothetical protein